MTVSYKKTTITTDENPQPKKQMGCGTQIIAITILTLLAWGAYELILHVAQSN